MAANFVQMMGKRFPALSEATRRISTQEVPLNVVREQLYAARAEYWFRKIESIPVTMSSAKSEACTIVNALKNYKDIRYMNIAKGFVWFVQIAGCFAIGEMLARGDMRGYPVGNYPGNPNMPHH